MIAPGFYGILDTGCLLGGARDDTRGNAVLDALDLLLDAGVRDVQLRCKDDAIRAPLGAQVAARMTGRGTRLWINDDLALARSLARVHDAGTLLVGVHLGQGDGDDPPDLPFGRSTHTLAQVTRPGRACYLGFGPVFGTTTKATAYPARGVAMLADAVRASPLPIVAIGGITPQNVAGVAATGVRAWTAIGAVWDAPARGAALRRLTLVS